MILSKNLIIESLK